MRRKGGSQLRRKAVYCIHSGDVEEWRNNSGAAVVWGGARNTENLCLYLTFVEKSFNCLLAVDVEIQCV